jgi:uncharacterized membrane protein YczE
MLAAQRRAAPAPARRTGTSTRPADPLVRPLLVIVGTALSAYGYLLTTTVGLGNGPLFAVQDGIHRHLGWSLGTTSIVVGLAIALLAAALRSPLGVGTVLIPVLAGWWIELFEPHLPAVHGVTARWLLFVGGTAVMMLGGAMGVAAAIGVSALDGIMLSLARLTGRGQAAVRLGMEATMAVGGFLIGGRIGAGTLVMGALVGHLFRFWTSCLQRLGVVRSEGERLRTRAR